MMWSQMGVERVPDKYVFRRWCKNVKRSSTSIEAHRHDNMCNIFNKVVDLAEDSQEKYNMVMTRVREIKRELMETSVVCESNVVSFGDGVIPFKQSTNILDPEGARLSDWNM
ncbi:hypothetical protein RHMOL_Rhmol04G0147000 [Rhododendron molle]|uniref:Uncharacterized protein n=1 Tax=Rhododendron molle TaxID=49168 RepID=A0ACC0P2U0_RHOML|nr:hypothetical protein RHMOL_Rhmol04G0147000 [Rhododendron molle]